MEHEAQILPRAWVLVDNRIGNANQAIELAEKLGETFEIKHIEYNAFGKLPNALLSTAISRSPCNTCISPPG
jgi:mitochondrial fission protein ELM1